MAAQEPFYRTLIGKAIIVVCYLGLNLSLNLSNKWVLSHYGFHFPLFLSISHMAFSFFALGPLMMCKPFREQHIPSLQRQWMGFLAVGVFFAVNIGFNNVSLLTISLSLNQVIRSSIPVVTALASVVVENKRPSRDEFLTLLLLTLGVAVAVWEGSSVHGSYIGITLCVLGTVSNGLMMTFSGRMMSEKVDVLRLTFYTAPIVMAVLAPFFVRMEIARVLEYAATKGSVECVVFILLTCINALAYNMIHYLVIQITSSVTTTVLGEMKIILILVLSATLLSEHGIWTLRMLVGCSMAIVSFCLYSHLKLKAHAMSAKPIIKGVPELAPSLGSSDPGGIDEEKRRLLGAPSWQSPLGQKKMSS